MDISPLDMMDDIAAGRTVRRVTLWGLAINLVLSAFKFIAGFIGASHAVIADAIHSLSDCTTDIAVIVGSHYWTKPADQDHPYGHRRIETVITILIGLVLLAAGIGIGRQALISLRHRSMAPPGAIAAWAAATSIVVKEILYRWTHREGLRVQSPALTANAWHHRLDAISSIPALLAVSAAMFFPAWSFLDCVGAMLVSALILHAAIGIIWPGLRELMDAGASRETCERLRASASECRGVRKIHRIRTRYFSNRLMVDISIVVDGAISVRAGHDIAENVRKAIMADRAGVLDVHVHVDPDGYQPAPSDLCR